MLNLHMANTFSQIYLHVVFAVKNREALLPATIRSRVYAYISTFLHDAGNIPLAIGGTDDHVHILFAYNINTRIPDVIRELKSNVSRFVNDNNLIAYKFEWQRGYGAFSYSHSHIEAVKRYIRNQTEHHKQISFKDELVHILECFGMDFDERYLFDEL